MTSLDVDFAFWTQVDAEAFLLPTTEMNMTEVLQEYVDSRGLSLRIDRASGVLRGVKLIGMESLNGRRYRPAALSAAVALYEGAKVNVNHPKDGPLAPRDYRDRLGVIRQVEFRPGEGLFGNLHFNPKHALAEQLAWDAENNPRNVGFSHNVLARLARDGEQTVVEAITHVQSVDLVADPAATQGLFEHDDAADGALQAVVAELAESRDQLRASVERETALRRRLAIYDACIAEGLLAPGRSLEECVGRSFYEVLTTAKEEQLASLITERAVALKKATERQPRPLAETGRPRSTDALSVFGRSETRLMDSAADFVRAIRG